jgi:hypothetical protein
VMIAHRLQTIATAQNLLYIDNPKRILAAEKGTTEYDNIMKKLKTETYKHQNDIGLETAKKLAEEEDSDSEGDAGILSERNCGPKEGEGALNLSLKMENVASHKVQ